ncbi:MAG: hypothetical protein WCU80_07550 [Paludibacteraceae bacterium]
MSALIGTEKKVGYNYMHRYRRYFFAAIFLVLLFRISGKDNISAQGRITYDKDELPLWKYFEGDTVHDSIEYFRQDHNKETVRFGIQYKHGTDSLRTLMSNHFTNNIDNSCEVMHIRIFYCILFDEHLRIKEVRFQRIGLVDRFIEQLDCCGYFSTLEDFIKTTQGDWKRDKKLKQKRKDGCAFFSWVEI